MMVRAAAVETARPSWWGQMQAWARRSFVTGPVDKSYRRLLAFMLLVGIGAVLSATFPLADKSLRADHPYEFVSKQLLYGGAGLLLMWGISFLSPSSLLWLARWAFIPGLVAMIMCRYSPWAHYVDGCWGWLKFSETRTVQPSELVKVIFVALLAWIMTLGKPGDTGPRAQFRVWLMTAVVLGAMCLVLLIQQDLGMMFVVFATTLAILYLRGIPWWQISGFALTLGLLGAGIAKFAFEERWKRVLVFLDPFVTYHEGGYHVRQMLATIARGGLGGLGLGMSPDKWGPLPTPHTDSIFCVIGAELGLLGALIVLGLVFRLADRSMKIGLRSGSAAGWYLAAGMGLLLAIQSIINIAVATVMMPCTGLTLPFISAGGSSLVSSLAAAGVVLAVSRLASAREADPECE